MDVKLSFVAEDSGFQNRVVASVGGTPVATLEEQGSSVAFKVGRDAASDLSLQMQGHGGEAERSVVRYYVDDGDGIIDAGDTLIWQGESTDLSLGALAKLAKNKTVLASFEDLEPAGSDFGDFVAKVEFSGPAPAVFGGGLFGRADPFWGWKRPGDDDDSPARGGLFDHII